jgi:hypothetical protein
MTDFPDLKLKAQLTYPASVVGGTGIDVTKENGKLVIDLDYSEFGQISALPANPNLYSLIYDTHLNSYTLAPVSLFGGGGGGSGIADAPVNGISYGRNSGAWVAIPVFDSIGTLQAATIAAGINYVQTAVRGVNNDMGAAKWQRVPTMPTHVGRVQSADGAWWELMGPEVHVGTFGADATGVADSFNAFSAALSVARAIKGVMHVDPGSYKVGSVISTVAGDQIVYSGMKYVGPSGIFDNYNAYTQFSNKSWLTHSNTADNSWTTVTTLTIDNTGGHTVAYEKSPGYDVCIQNDPSPAGGAGGSRDGVGRVMQAFAGVGNMSAHVFGMNCYAVWPAGSDGTGEGAEINTINNASATASLNADTTKTGLGIICAGSAKSTQALTIQANGIANGWFDAINVRADGITNYMLRLIAPGSYTVNYFSVDASGNIVQNSPGSANLTLGANAGAPAYIHFKVNGVDQSFISDNGSSINIFSNAAGTQGQYLAHNSSSWGTPSDARLPYKQTARPLTVLDKLDAVQLYENEVDGQLQLFVKAQELNAAFPHLVHVGSGSEDYVPTGMGDPNMWGVTYDRAGVVALQGLKELRAEIMRLQEMVRKLGGEA